MSSLLSGKQGVVYKAKVNLQCQGLFSLKTQLACVLLDGKELPVLVPLCLSACRCIMTNMTVHLAHTYAAGTNVLAC